MLVHTVLFWLKPDLSGTQIAQFAEGINSLTKIASVRHGFVGKPSSTDRPVIDRSYSYALTVVFDGMAGHDTYQSDPSHLKFLKDCGQYWSRVQIYDAE